MVRSTRVKESRFEAGTLVANAEGSLDVFSDQAINGTIQSVQWEAGNHTSTGSILIFESGITNNLLMKVSGISVDSIVYPFVYQNDSATPFALGSATGAITTSQLVINSPLRVVGSGLGDAKSGLSLVVRYI